MMVRLENGFFFFFKFIVFGFLTSYLIRQEDRKGENQITFLTDLLRLQAGPAVREAEALPWMEGRIYAFNCRIGAFKCSMKRNLKHPLGCDRS